MASSSSSVFQVKSREVLAPSPAKSLVSGVPLGRVGVGAGRGRGRGRAKSKRTSSVPNRAIGLEKGFYGTKFGALGSETLPLWQSDGPGRAPKLRMVVRSALSQVPDKPLGLYDPSYDKDSCGVGFVAELSGQSSRKTV